MKPHPALVCLAVAATAAAAESKDPTAVAREWNHTIEQAREVTPAPSTLLEQSLAAPKAPLAPSAARPARSFRPRPWGPLYDAPATRPPSVLPDNMPPGSQWFMFNGQVYWKVPLGPGRDK